LSAYRDTSYRAADDVSVRHDAVETVYCADSQAADAMISHHARRLGQKVVFIDEFNPLRHSIPYEHDRLLKLMIGTQTCERACDLKAATSSRR
jgi:hypothetical protein